MAETPSGSYSQEVVTTYVWDAIKGIPGVVGLHRHVLQSFGEKVRVEGRGPVRLEQNELGVTVEVHIVVGEGVTIPAVALAVAEATAAYLPTMLGTTAARVHVFVDDVAASPPADE